MIISGALLDPGDREVYYNDLTAHLFAESCPNTSENSIL